MYYMTYKTILTTKGTTTIPAIIRKSLGVKPGMYVTFSEGDKPGEYIVKRSLTLAELRQLNREALQKAGTTKKRYTGGDGFRAHVAQRYRK
jgi:bifunctional DNA-binding transcriptional regulator/antitoxin component of YhaV-PrlF toxin-antitoxin module